MAGHATASGTAHGYSGARVDEVVLNAGVVESTSSVCQRVIVPLGGAAVPARCRAGAGPDLAHRAVAG